MCYPQGVAGLTRLEMRQYLQYVADQRLLKLGLPVRLRLTATPSPSWNCRMCRN